MLQGNQIIVLVQKLCGFQNICSLKPFGSFNIFSAKDSSLFVPIYTLDDLCIAKHP